MRGFVGIVLASALAACGGSQDFCTRLKPVFEQQETQINTCPASDDAGSTMAAISQALGDIGVEFPFSLASCQARIAGCASNDLTKLDHELTCIQQLKAFDCGALGEDPDAGLADFQNAIGGCLATDLSHTCQGTIDGGLGCGTETHTVNTNKNTPLPLGFQTAIPDCLGVVNGVSDTHFLQLNAPAMPAAGGYFTVTFSALTQNVQGQLNVTLNDPSGSQLYKANYTVSSSPTQLFLAAAASTSFLIEVTGDSQLPLGYTVLAQYTGINDPYKPDSQRTSPAPMPLTLGAGTTDSYYWAGQRNAEVLIPTVDGDFDDWFSFQLTSGGTVTVTLTQFPFDFAPEVDFVDDTGVVIRPSSGQSSSTSTGTVLQYTALAPTAGTYYAHVFATEVDTTPGQYATYSANPLTSSIILPPHFVQPYELVVKFAE